LACRQEPYPWFVDELECIFSHGGNSFELKWDHRRGAWSLREKALGRWYHIMYVYPFEQHRQTLRMLRRSNVRNPQHQEDFQAEVGRVDRERESRTQRMAEWSGHVVKEVARAASFDKISSSRKSHFHEKSYAEGLQREIERDSPGLD